MGCHFHPMTYLPSPENEDERLADGWWDSLLEHQRETYVKVRDSKAASARLNARLKQEKLAEGGGCGVFFLLLLLAALFLAILAPILLGLFGYGIDIYPKWR